MFFFISVIPAGNQRYFMHFEKGIFTVKDSHMALNICPRHRDNYGLHWLCNRARFAVPKECKGHLRDSAKVDRGVDVQSEFIYSKSGVLISVGSRVISERKMCMCVCV